MSEVEAPPRAVQSRIKGKVLCVEDDPVAQFMFADVVTKAGGACEKATSIAEATKQIQDQKFDLVILDRRLPDGDGLLLINAIQRSQPNCRIMVISALDETRDKDLGIGLGAAEYLAKPIDPVELGNLIHKLLPSRSESYSASQGTAFHLNDAVFCLNTRALKLGGEAVFLPPSEARLLQALLEAKGEPKTRDALTHQVFRREWSHGDRTVDVLIARLRQKIPKNVARIVTINRLGYVLLLD